MSSARFTYPFRYVPSPEIRRAAHSLIERIGSDESLRPLFAEGKMMGVLQTDAGFLYAFSGLAGGRAVIDGFVPPIYDYTDPEGYFRKTEARISAMPDGEQKSRMSAELQDWLFHRYRVSNARGESLDIAEIFSRRGLVPPAGTGDCAAPRLLQYAYSRGMKPLAMGEFWYGESRGGKVREHGRFYPACTGKCGPLLNFMLEGLDVEPNPMDREYHRREPETIYIDADIIVVNKPAGLLSVPGKLEVVSLLDYLRDRYGRVYSCHRLDMDTSGLMVYARNMDARADIEEQFARRIVKKTYRARLCSAPTPFGHARKGTIALPLMLDYYDRPRQMVDFEHGKFAVTRYEVLSELPDGEIDIRFFPYTGRTHQLRVHSAHKLGLGRPIKGDTLYGSPESGDRLYLHAESLEFLHPSDGDRMSFSDPVSDWSDTTCACSPSY